MKRILLVPFLVASIGLGMAIEERKFTCAITEVEEMVTPHNLDKFIEVCNKKGKGEDGKQMVMQVIAKLPMVFFRDSEGYSRPEQVNRYLELQGQWNINLSKEQHCGLVELLNPKRNKYISMDQQQYQQLYQKWFKSLQCGGTSSLSNSNDRQLNTIVNHQESILKRLDAFNQSLRDSRQPDTSSQLFHIRNLLISLVLLLILLNVLIFWIVIAPPRFIRKVIIERESKLRQRIESEKAFERWRAVSPIKIQIEPSSIDVHVQKSQMDASNMATLEELKRIQSSIYELLVKTKRYEHKREKELEQAKSDIPSAQLGRKPRTLTDRSVLLTSSDDLLAATTTSEAEEVAKRYGFKINVGKLDRRDSDKSCFSLVGDKLLSNDTHLFALIYKDAMDNGYLVPLALKGQILTAPANWFYSLQAEGRSSIDRIIKPACVHFSGQDRQWFTLSSKGEMG